MATYNFHIRDLRNVEGLFKFESGYYKSGNTYTNSDEVFLLFPVAINSNGYVAYVNDYNDPTDPDFLAKCRINNDDATVAGYSYAQGDINGVEEGYLRLRYGNNSVGKVYLYGLAEIPSRWTNNNWSNPSTDYSIWKAEVTDFLAQAIDSETESIASYTDWSVQIYDYFVIFYPGNDPEADEIVQEVV